MFLYLKEYKYKRSRARDEKAKTRFGLFHVSLT